MFLTRLFALVVTVCLYSMQINSLPQEDSEVYVNGEKMKVYFNDGDTFRVLQGSLRGSSARLVGFNTLESYGPVHQWGDWTAKELYKNSYDATKNARRGGWHCETDSDKDGYGRILADCRDLALDMISKGLAHAMTVTSEGATEDLVKAQQKAIKNKIGFWKKGVPDYILTSAHSMAEFAGEESSYEGARAKKRSYDRFVSTKDGHSFVSNHGNTYEECEIVSYLPKGVRDAKSASAFVYVDFKHRYGANRAECLR
ncbi:MAG: thermonuclease family protein [bacterium]|nr:thermonuclease family protein [bacterium]